MYWLWKWLESYNNCTFSTWKDTFLFNLLFWIPNSFYTFQDYARGGTPFLASPDGPSLIFYHSDVWTTFLLWKNRVALKLFTLLKYFLSFRLLSNLWLALKNRVCLEFTVFNIHIFNHSEFWTTCACPEKQSLPWNFSPHWNIFNFQDFWGTCACPENRVCHESFRCI